MSQVKQAGVPYASVLGDRDPAKVIAKTPRKLIRLLDELSDKQIEARPAPGKWNVRETIAHLADCEIAWAWRLRHTLEQNKPVIQPFDQDAWARPYEAYSLAEALGCFKALRKWNVALVETLSDKDWKSPVEHPERGRETLRTVVEIMAGHDLHHLAALEQVGERGKGKK